MKLNRKVFSFLAAFILVSALGSTGVWKKGFNSPGNALAQDEEEEKAEEQAPCPECPECPDPAKVVLRGLEEKKQTIEKARKTLEQERKDLERYEEQIDEKLTALESVKKQIQDDLALIEQKKSQKELENEAAYEAKLARLVKMYAAMKPKSAAQIVDKMDLEVAQEIFFRMREASASQILSFVDSGKAAKISERLAYKRK
ncbi:MotE family protein [Desulfospira joergensenii]|uniref:MotE family protein n=1 Tax=Desulfospira joergensenii TaxID=53329 RepID=UPI0003B4CD0C|nr:hypothetical protein [Desulfospira joergensenii]